MGKDEKSEPETALPLVGNWKLRSLPDRTGLNHTLSTDEDILTAASNDNEQFLQIFLNSFKDGECITLRALYDPTMIGRRAHERLSISLAASVSSESGLDLATTFIAGGPLSRFYTFDRAPLPEIPWERFGFAHHVARRVTAVKPAIRREFNPLVPKGSYYVIDSFRARANIDGLHLDRAGIGLDQYAMVDFSLSATAIDRERTALALHLEHYRTLASPWQEDEHQAAAPRDYLGHESELPFAHYAAERHRRAKDPVADEVADRLRDIRRTLTQPHCLFHIRVLSETEAYGRLLAAQVAESMFMDGAYTILPFPKCDPYFAETLDCARQFRISPVPFHALLPEAEDRQYYTGLERMASVSPVSDVARAFRIPIASDADTHCIGKDTDPSPLRGVDVWVVGYGPVRAAGQDVDEEASVPRGLPLKDLSTHVLITGAPGTGKSTFGLNLELSLANAEIPYLAFESSKKEYRSLKLLKPRPGEGPPGFPERLEVYTVGQESPSPFCLNLCDPEGMTIDEAIADTARCFESSLPMGGALPGLLQEGLESLHNACRNAERRPSLSDLCSLMNRMMLRKGYSENTLLDLRSALDTRLGTLMRGHMGRIFRCRTTIPSIEHLAKSWSVFELDDLSVEQAGLVLLTYLSRIAKHFKNAPWDGKKLRFCVIIEESHKILGESSEAHIDEVSANTKAYATETICRMLAEFRSLGIGVVIIDQLASVLASQAGKIPGTHIAFRQTEARERELIANAMGLTPLQTYDLGRLNVGEAYFWTSGYHKPIKIRTVDFFRRFTSCE